MGIIKSAWEIALERSESIVIDKDKLKKDEEIKQIRSILGRYLSDDDKLDIEKLKSFNKDIINEAVLIVLDQNLILPHDSLNEQRMEKINKIAWAVSTKEEFLSHTTNIITFLRQYPNHKTHLIEQIKAQFKTMIEQKNPNENIDLDNNPEFAQILKTQLEKLAANYIQTLEESKKQLAKLI